MFKCQKCGAQSKPRAKQHHVVLETRAKTYINGERGETVTKGTEIVKEIHVGDCCAPKA